ncbi:MAG TPA: CHRD domain-containing protein [Chloroflexota bacterium]|nr:CHRD domain-containing protein [Chloroflexota bacterium]
MSILSRCALGVVVLAAGALAGSGAASAHAPLVSANIQPGQIFTANDYPRTLTAFFGQNVDPKVSYVHVFQDIPPHGMVDSLQNGFPATNTKEITTSLPAGLSGVYTVVWYTHSADDGAWAGSTFTFTVEPPDATGAGLLGLAGLTSQAHSTATGAVFLSYNWQEAAIDVSIAVSGLAPNSVHPAHIHAGNSCAANGPVLYPLPNLKADAQGQAYASAMIPATSVPAQGWYVNVHQGPSLTGAGATPISCGVVQQAAAAATLAPEAGSTARGIALLGPGTTSDTVIIRVTGLAPNSVHPAHIHLGASCTANGPVLYPLPDLHADAAGVAWATTTITGTAIPGLGSGPSGYYLNVHSGPTMSGSGATPISCGIVDPTL